MAIYYKDGRVEYQGQVVATNSSSTQYVLAFDTLHYVIVWDGRDFQDITTSFYHDGLEDNPHGIVNVVIDAPTELREIWNKRCEYQKRRSEVLEKKRDWETLKDRAKAIGIRFSQLKRLQEVLEPSDCGNVYYLLLQNTRGKLRSPFRKSIAQQVLDWLKEPKYRTPLSVKQLVAIQPYKAY